VSRLLEGRDFVSQILLGADPRALVAEAITLDVEIGDTILTGKYKNKKTVVKEIGEDEHGMPTINGRKAATFRYSKKADEKDEARKYEAQFDFERNPTHNIFSMGEDEASGFMAAQMAKKGLDLDREIPDFRNNFRQLASKGSRAKNIPRVEMPVIEPRDMDEFERAIQQGHIDLFKPFAFGFFNELFPEQLRGTEADTFLTLGLKDGQVNDDVIRANMTAIPAGDLLPLQNQVWLDLVAGYTAEFGTPKPGSRVLDTPIIVSKEGYILDGHHRWAQVSVADPSLPMKALQVPLDIDTLLKMGRAYGDAIGNTRNV
jgi:hypothetical protein